MIDDYAKFEESIKTLVPFKLKTKWADTEDEDMLMMGFEGDLKLTEDLNKILGEKNMLKLDYETHFIEKNDIIENLIKDIFPIFGNEAATTVFISQGADSKGLNWHIDEVHVVGVNLLGHTIWKTEGLEDIHLHSGEALFMPSGAKHTVEVISPDRCTLGIYGPHITKI